MKKKLILCILFLFVTVSCSNTTQTVKERTLIQSTQTPKVILSATSFPVTNTPVPTLIISTPTIIPPSPTPTLEPFLEGIPTGEHMICKVEDRLADYLYVFNPTGELVKRIGPFEDWQLGDFSPDAQKYMYTQENVMIVDLNTWAEHQMPNKSGCTFSYRGSWSKDGKYVLLDCNEDVSVKVIDIQDGTVAGVAPAPNPDAGVIMDGIWSPDGKWVAYIASELKQGGVVGPYIVPSSCLQNTPECKKQVVAINVCIESCLFWWTSENQMAVDYNATDHDGWLLPDLIGIFDPMTGAHLKDEDLGGKDNLVNYSWSPSGHYLVIEGVRENGARIVKEIASGKVLFDLDDVSCNYFLGWLNIP